MMTQSTELFFELLRVSVGTQNQLSREPSSKEWAQIYKIAKKQCLVGICFAGVKRICDSEDEYYFGMSEKQYLTWIGMVAWIQHRNKVFNKKCEELLKLLDADGFFSVILKGQGVAKLYGSLAQLRQSGDIDVWMCPKDGFNLSHTERAIEVINYLKSKAECGHTTYHNTLWNVLDGTKVEAHYTPSWMYSPMKNRRLQRWFESVAEKEMKGEFSTVEFNVVYVLLHIYRHLLGEGIGMRQVVDFYMVLCAVSSLNSAQKERGEVQGVARFQEVSKVLKRLGMMRFTNGIMWVIQHVLVGDNPSELSNYQTLLNSLGLKADEREGRFLLNEIMMAGNFGRYDVRIDRKRNNGFVGTFWKRVKRNMTFINHYPSEVLWCPLWKVWHQLWLIRLRKSTT